MFGKALQFPPQEALANTQQVPPKDVADLSIPSSTAEAAEHRFTKGSRKQLHGCKTIPLNIHSHEDTGTC